MTHIILRAKFGSAATLEFALVSLLLLAFGLLRVLVEPTFQLLNDLPGVAEDIISPLFLRQDLHYLVVCALDRLVAFGFSRLMVKAAKDLLPDWAFGPDAKQIFIIQQVQFFELRLRHDVLVELGWPLFCTLQGQDLLAGQQTIFAHLGLVLLFLETVLVLKQNYR